MNKAADSSGAANRLKEEKVAFNEETNLIYVIKYRKYVWQHVYPPQFIVQQQILEGNCLQWIDGKHVLYGSERESYV